MPLSIIRRIAALSFVLSSSLLAQTLSVTPADLTQGSTANLEYTNVDLAGQHAFITVCGGSPIVTVTIEIVLDANGHGTHKWVVPDWRNATFNAPGVAQQDIPIE